jgi:hypothetical protein
MFACICFYGLAQQEGRDQVKEAAKESVSVHAKIPKGGVTVKFVDCEPDSDEAQVALVNLGCVVAQEAKMLIVGNILMALQQYSQQHELYRSSMGSFVMFNNG